MATRLENALTRLSKLRERRDVLEEKMQQDQPHGEMYNKHLSWKRSLETKISFLRGEIERLQGK